MISRDAFAQEVRALTDTAYAVTYLILGNSADCEDAMSAAILRAFENRGKLRKRESFRAWFLQILRHEAYDLLKKRRRLTPVEELPEGLPKPSERPCSCSRRATILARSARSWTCPWGR